MQQVSRTVSGSVYPSVHKMVAEQGQLAARQQLLYAGKKKSIVTYSSIICTRDRYLYPLYGPPYSVKRYIFVITQHTLMDLLYSLI